MYFDISLLAMMHNGSIKHWHTVVPLFSLTSSSCMHLICEVVVQVQPQYRLVPINPLGVMLHVVNELGIS